MPALIWLAFCNRRFLHWIDRTQEAFIEELAVRTTVMKPSMAWGSFVPGALSTPLQTSTA
jgi:hypothetical protein